MSKELEQSRSYYLDGRMDKAVDALEAIRLSEDLSADELQTYLDFAEELCGRTEGRLKDDCEHFIGRVKLLLPHPPSTFRLMLDMTTTCPLCGADMVPGVFAVEGTALRALVVGTSWQSLWFHPAASDSAKKPKREELIGDPRRGWRCRGCGASFIVGKPVEVNEVQPTG